MIVAAVPGIKPEDVEITFESDTLTIRGEFPGALENVEYVVRERRHGSFVRTVSFNVPVNADGIEATFEHGVLTIVAPRSRKSSPRPSRFSRSKQLCI
ncbi:MAG: Hsp20/alpha crystallin family protein [Anaerolineales bacterium]|nr:Hsp20/alpha crystallin family protein [Anaerolineales bacterium]